MYPECVLDQYYDSLALETRRESLILADMEKRKKEAIAKISTIVRPDCAEMFAKVLSFAYWEEIPEASDINKFLRLETSDFLSIDENLSEFIELLRKEAM